jgi:hypothetical protein
MSFTLNYFEIKIMKHIISVFISLFLISNTYSQTQTKPLVKVNQWGNRALYILDGFFNETKDDIINQVGEEEYNKIKTNSQSSSWPKEFNTEYGQSDDDEKKFYEKLNKLKMYKIATYQHKYNGNVFEKYVILKIPYHTNEFWDSNVKWDKDVYFILNESDVEEISEN